MYSLLLALLSVAPSVPTSVQTATERLETAKQAYFDGDHQGASDLLEDLVLVLTAPGELADAHAFLGMSRLALGNDAAAQLSFQAAVRFNPDYVPNAELLPPTAFSAFQSVRNGMVGRIDIKTAPPGARALIDGRFVGTTPYLGNILAGTHVVRVEQPRFRTYEANVDVSPGDTAFVDVAMEMTEGSIGVTTGTRRKRGGSKALAFTIIGGAAAAGTVFALRATGSSREAGVPVTRTFQNNIAPFQNAGPFIADVGTDGTLTVDLTWDNPDANINVQLLLITAVFEPVREIQATEGSTQVQFTHPVTGGNVYQVVFQNFSPVATNFTLVINFPG